MNKVLKLMISLGGAAAAAKAVRSVSDLDFGMDNVLEYMGLERNRSRVWEKMAFFGMGALAGAGAGLLLAPASGRETRAKISDGVDKLASKATETLAEIKEQAPELIGKVTGQTSGNATGHTTTTHRAGNQTLR